MIWHVNLFAQYIDAQKQLAQTSSIALADIIARCDNLDKFAGQSLPFLCLGQDLPHRCCELNHFCKL